MEQRAFINSENFEKGFLIDDEWMAGIQPVQQNDSTFYQAYIINHASGESVGEHYFKELNSAIEAFKAMDREWHFESTSKCSAKDGACRKIGGNCAGDRCETCACLT